MGVTLNLICSKLQEILKKAFAFKTIYTSSEQRKWEAIRERLPTVVKIDETNG